MNRNQCPFVQQLFGVVVAGLIPVVLVGFLTIPFNLGSHPGEERAATTPAQAHMT